MSVATSNKVCYCGKPLYVYFKIAGSASSTNRCKEAEVMESVARRTIPYVRDNVPAASSGFSRYMSERVMRTMTFGTYRSFRKIYETSIARQILEEMPDRTIEMNVFLKCPSLYYAILFTFSHWSWDRKTGTWGRVL